MKIHKILTAITAFAVTGCGQPDPREPEFFGSNFSISSCVQHAGDGVALEYFLENKMKINQLAQETAQHFLIKAKGKAWSLTVS